VTGHQQTRLRTSRTNLHSAASKPAKLFVTVNDDQIPFCIVCDCWQADIRASYKPQRLRAGSFGRVGWQQDSVNWARADERHKMLKERRFSSSMWTDNGCSASAFCSKLVGKVSQVSR
jgi:hypothetical protein